MFTRTLHFRGISCMCRVHYNVVAEPQLSSVQLDPMAPFAYYGQSLVPALLIGQAGDGLCLSWLVWAFAVFSLNWTAAGCSLSVVSRDLHKWVGSAIIPFVCPQPSAGLHLNWFVCIFVCSPRAWVTLYWFWPLSGLLAQCQFFGSSLGGPLLLLGSVGQIGRRGGGVGRAHGVSKVWTNLL